MVLRQESLYTDASPLLDQKTLLTDTVSARSLQHERLQLLWLCPWITYTARCTRMLSRQKALKAPEVILILT